MLKCCLKLLNQQQKSSIAWATALDSTLTTSLYCRASATMDCKLICINVENYNVCIAYMSEFSLYKSSREKMLSKIIITVAFISINFSFYSFILFSAVSGLAVILFVVILGGAYFAARIHNLQK